MKDKEKVFNFSDCFIGYDVSYDKSHTSLSIMIKEKEDKMRAYTFHDEEAKVILYVLDELTSINKMLEKRLKHLLNSKIIQLLDEIDSHTHTYKYDISKFDNAYPVIISLGRRGTNIPVSIEKFYNQEVELIKLKDEIKNVNKGLLKTKEKRNKWKKKYYKEHYILSNLESWLNGKGQNVFGIGDFFITISLMDIKNEISKLKKRYSNYDN